MQLKVQREGDAEKENQAKRHPDASRRKREKGYKKEKKKKAGIRHSSTVLSKTAEKYSATT